jgi:hypothetical protein
VLDHKPATEDLMTNFEIYVGLVDWILLVQ